MDELENKAQQEREARYVYLSAVATQDSMRYAISSMDETAKIAWKTWQTLRAVDEARSPCVNVALWSVERTETVLTKKAKSAALAADQALLRARQAEEDFADATRLMYEVWQAVMNSKEAALQMEKLSIPSENNDEQLRRAGGETGGKAAGVVPKPGSVGVALSPTRLRRVATGKPRRSHGDHRGSLR